MRSARPKQPGRGSRRGFTVALLGPDGSGKTTLARALASEAPLRARRFYMGANPEARNVGLPRAEWMSREAASSAGNGRRPRASMRKGVGFLHRLADQWYRYALARWHRSRGGVVVFDRYIYRPRMLERPVERRRRIQRWLLRLGAPRPDLVVVLDAPPEVLLARKKEHGADRLERMRRDYARLGRLLPEAVVMDASRDAEEVKKAVLSLIRGQLENRANGREKQKR